MNPDVSIHRMAIREAETLGIVQAVVAKKRQELEQRLLREKVQKGERPGGAGLDQALGEMAAENRQPAEPGSGTHIDKTA